MSRTQVITVGYSGYGEPYQAALGPSYEYSSIGSATEVADIEWRDVYAVVFSGGADINPAVYNEERGLETFCDEWHDALDDAVIAAIASHPNIYKFGTCRGAQRLFCTYLGGKLIQDIPHHYGGHGAVLVPYCSRGNIDAEGCTTTLTGPAVMDINSIHHQAMRWDTVSQAEYYGDEDGEFWDGEDDYDTDKPPPFLLMTGEAEGQTAVEAWISYETRCVGFQYHPEWLDESSDAYQWTQEAIKTLVRKLSAENAAWAWPSPRPDRSMF